MIARSTTDTQTYFHDRIDQNTDDIEMNVMSAQTELLKYYQNMMSNRGLVIKVFLTIVFFFFVFTMIT